MVAPHRDVDLSSTEQRNETSQILTNISLSLLNLFVPEGESRDRTINSNGTLVYLLTK